MNRHTLMTPVAGDQMESAAHEHDHTHEQGAGHTAFRPWLYPEVTNSLWNANGMMLMLLVVIHVARWRRRR